MAAVNPAAILFLISNLYEQVQNLTDENSKLRQELEATRAQVPSAVMD